MTHASCTYPGCGGSGYEPAYTDLGWCLYCQQRFRRQLDWLVMDWVMLNRDLPGPLKRGLQPVGGGGFGSAGHPAEWASDMCSEIAHVLHDIHDELADKLGYSAPIRVASEAARVRNAYSFIEPRIDQLALFEVEDSAQTVIDLHREIRARLGLLRHRQLLPTPCPKCELRGVLSRSVSGPHKHMDGITRGVDSIDCANCGHVIAPHDYQSYAGLVLDTILDTVNQA